MSTLDDHLAGLGDEGLRLLVTRAARSPSSGSSIEVLNHLLLSSLRQEAMLAELVRATRGHAELAPPAPPAANRPSSTRSR